MSRCGEGTGDGCQDLRGFAARWDCRRSGSGRLQVARRRQWHWFFAQCWGELCWGV